MDRVEVTIPALGFCAMQVCAKTECTDLEILSVCNSKNPSGTFNGWAKVYRKADEVHGDESLPVQCADYSDRTHFIVMC